MSLCSICEALDIDARSRLGEYTELIDRAERGCEACIFFVNILQNSDRWSTQLDKLPGKIAFLSSQRLDVRSPENETGSSWGCDDLLFDYVVDENYTGEKDEDTDVRKVVPAHSGEERCFDQIRKWGSECEGHKDCPVTAEVSLPPRIIEVSSDTTVSPKLILSNGMKGKYIVFSHVSDSSAEFKSPQIGESFTLGSIPNTFADAIVITRRLGCQYLWIPALCIPPEDTVLEISNFPAIYGQASLMISASTISDDLSTSIFHERKIFYSPAIGKNKDRHLRQKCLRWNWDLKLSSSGWNVVERILAPRIVHYAKRQMIWECADGIKFEAAGVPDTITGSGQKRMRYNKGFVQPFVTSYLQRQGASGSSSGTGLNAQQPSERLEAWHQIVNEISQHTFEGPKDKVLTTSLIARLLSPNQELGPYISGLWNFHLASSLAWGRVFGVLTPTTEYIAPSWNPFSVDGNTSSMFLDWKPAMFTHQAQHPDFVIKHAPTLLSTALIPLDPSNAYSPLKPDSNITISASVTKLEPLLEKIQKDEDNTFHPTFVLDQSSILDCHHCDPSAHANSSHEEEMRKFEVEYKEFIVVFLEGAFWGLDLGEGVVDCLVLKKRVEQEVGNAGKEGGGDLEVMGEEEGWERIGFLRISLEYRSEPVWQKSDGGFDREFVERRFEGMGWARKSLKLY